MNETSSLKVENAEIDEKSCPRKISSNKENQRLKYLYQAKLSITNLFCEKTYLYKEPYILILY